MDSANLADFFFLYICNILHECKLERIWFRISERKSRFGFNEFTLLANNLSFSSGGEGMEDFLKGKALVHLKFKLNWDIVLFRYFKGVPFSQCGLIFSTNTFVITQQIRIWNKTNFQFTFNQKNISSRINEHSSRANTYMYIHTSG